MAQRNYLEFISDSSGGWKSRYQQNRVLTKALFWAAHCLLFICSLDGRGEGSFSRFFVEPLIKLIKVLPS